MINQNVILESVYAGVSALGGVAKYLNGYLRGHRFDLWKLVASAVVSVFSGVTCAHLIHLVRPDWEVIAAAVGGFMGGEAMTFIATVVAKRLGVEYAEPKRNSKDPVLETKDDK